MAWRSPRVFAGSAVLLLGVALGVLAIAIGAAASAIFHVALAAAFFLIASAVFDFRLPSWMTWTANAAFGVLAFVFLLQAIADVTQSEPLRSFAYDTLGQSSERTLGYVFLLWCAAVVFLDSEGSTRLLGIATVGIVVAVEAVTLAMALSGNAPPEALKLATLLLFVWLLAESWKPRSG